MSTDKQQAEHLHKLVPDFEPLICEHEAVIVITLFHDDKVAMKMNGEVSTCGSDEALENAIYNVMLKNKIFAKAARKAVKQLKNPKKSETFSEFFQRMSKLEGKERTPEELAIVEHISKILKP